MANELIINASLPETRIALMEGGEIQELLIERASGKGIVGNIYKGRVTRVLPGMQAAFVDIGLEKAAFLYVDDVYVHSEIWDDEESENQNAILDEPEASNEITKIELSAKSAEEAAPTEPVKEAVSEGEEPLVGENPQASELPSGEMIDSFEEDEDDDESEEPAEMGPESPGSEDPPHSDQPAGTISSDGEVKEESQSGAKEDASEDEAEGASTEASEEGQGSSGKRRPRRGRRGGRFRRRPSNSEGANQPAPVQTAEASYPENYHEQVADAGTMASDRAGLQDEAHPIQKPAEASEGRPEQAPREIKERRPVMPAGDRSEFRASRSRDRRIRQKTSSRPVKAQVNIQDLLKEGQEVLVQVAKDPIATKGARLTCHISLPGRHLVCMPTIDHVGVSRRIEREDERRRLREYVERSRPRNLGFIVRTASGRQQSEKRIKQDIEYLTRIWTEIKEKASSVTAPALVYEDLNSVLRAIRDWVTEEIDKVIVDSRYHFNEIQRFVSHFMPPLKQKVELYHGDIPIFDAYGISTELSRALERKVWLKSGGYIVVDQAEALVAIDVNTGRYVGKKNLEDTILKTNLEAVQEIAYQLRLRNCGGIIILDLIDMEKDENRQRVYRALEEALSKDRARPSILKISELGLIEMTRKRTRDTIIRTLCESCAHCEGKGFIKSKQTVAYEVMREIEREGIERDVNKILVQAHPDVIDILAIDERESLDQLERRYRKLIYLQAVTDFHPEQFEVTADKKAERSREGHRDQHHGHHHRGDHRHSHRDQGGDRHHDGPAHREKVSADPEERFVVKPLAQPIAPASVVEPTAPTGVPVEEKAPSENQPAAPAASAAQSQDGFDEEDRLAFLRAQAAQDAALARLGNGGVRNPNEGTQSRSNNHVGGRRPARGKRGGKFRRGNDRSRDRGPRPYGYNSGSQKWSEGSKEPANTAETGGTPITPVTGSAMSGDGNGGNGNGNAGDHSQPPV